MSITILPFTPERASMFDRLNRAWIEELFHIEPKDIAVLTNPQSSIIDQGGEVWFGALNDAIVGACALLVDAPGILEFSKLGVAKEARGHGVARALLRHCKTRAIARNADILRIYTNSKLAAANALYQSENFVRVTMTDEQKQRYQRVDILYDLPLKTQPY